MFETFIPEVPDDAVLALHVLEHVDEPADSCGTSRSGCVPTVSWSRSVPNAQSTPPCSSRFGWVCTSEFDDLSPRDRLVGHRRVYDLDGLHADLEAGGPQTGTRLRVLREALSNGQMLDWAPELLEGSDRLSDVVPPSAARQHRRAGPPRLGRHPVKGEEVPPHQGADHRSTPRSPRPRPSTRVAPAAVRIPAVAATTSRKLVAIGAYPDRPGQGFDAARATEHEGDGFTGQRGGASTGRGLRADRDDCDHCRHDEGRRRLPTSVHAHVRGPRGAEQGHHEQRASAAAIARSLSAGAGPATDPPPRRRSRAPSGSAMSHPSVPPAAASPAAATWPVSRPASSSAAATT